MNQNTKPKPSMASDRLATFDADQLADSVLSDQPDSYSASYFDAIYSDNVDPWHYQTRWYEKRKRDISLAILPQAKYDKGIELGCANGVFSALLADRCHNLLSIDGNKQAVELAKKQLAGLPKVKVIQGIIPEVLSTLNELDLNAENRLNSLLNHKPAFDLIVISEILYYLSPADIDKTIAWVEQNIAKGGTLLCCHWRYAIDGFDLTGETVHKRLHQRLNQHQPFNFIHQSQVVDSDFLLDIWHNSTKTIASQDNLI